MRASLILAAFILTATLASGYAIKQYGNARFSEGQLSERAKQLNTDNAALIESAQKMVEAFEQTQSALHELDAIPDNPPAGPNVQFAFERLRADRLQANGNQNPAPRPTSKPERDR